MLHGIDAVHVGIATQTPGGLMVPVIRHAEALDIWDCARELGRVTDGSARRQRATREELTGSTITLTCARHARRDRGDADHQSPRGCDHRPQQTA